MDKKQKLELTWVGKEGSVNLEPRLLIHNQELSCHDFRISDKDIHNNMLIHGDNLLALKALEPSFAGKIKCIYIDPPYNTGNAFEYYDDCLEVSTWLNLMYFRLDLLKNLLSNDGVIFVQIDDNYFSHLKLIMDEVFGRSSYINTITMKTKNASGASGGGEDRRLKKNTEFLLVYAKKDFVKFNPVYVETEFGTYLEEMKESGKSFKYTTIMKSISSKEYYTTIKDGSGNDIKIFKINKYETESISSVCRREGLSEVEAINTYFDMIFTTENAQTSIRTRVHDATDNENNMYSIEYIPVSGRNKGKTTELYFVGPQKRLVSWLRNVAVKRNTKVYKKEKIGTFWDGLNWNNVTREGGVRFPNGQKPEVLLQRVIELATQPGDLVLDSFLGSGTTAAVAHKMGRRWIGIELGEHCYTHSLPRLKGVVSGEDSKGISKAVDWKGGGGFQFYELGPSLITKDPWGNPVINPKFNPAMLSEAMCKLEGFIYAPSDEFYWIHGHSTETDFIYVTTQFMSREMLIKISDEVGTERSLLVCCTAFKCDTNEFSNLTLKKIPKAVLMKCEWGHDDYSLAVANLPETPHLPTPEAEPQKEIKSRSFGKAAQQASFFD